MTDQLREESVEMSSEVNWNFTFKQKIYSSDAQPHQFRDLFVVDSEAEVAEKTTPYTSSSSTPAQQLLLIFIRHFFCGNCQEYLRRLVAEPCLSPNDLAKRNIRVKIIGCGKPSLISSYREVTNIPQTWQIFTDPTTDLYRQLGMHRTLSLGKKSPRYIQRSLTSGMLQSVVQGMRRIPEGDVMGAGSLNINGGEFFFSLVQDATKREVRAEDWTLKWCHRMQNSRDHTEVDDLLRNIGLTSKLDALVLPSPKPLHMRTQSAPLVTMDEQIITSENFDTKPNVSDTVRPNFRRSLSKRRQSWMNAAEHLVRSKSKRRSITLQLKADKIATTATLAETR